MVKEKLKVVVVEDEPLACRAMATFFEMIGCEARMALTGAEALSIVSDFHPDLVTLDIRMPGMSGIETLHQLKAAEHSCQVIIISAYDDEKTYQRAIKELADAFLPKPIDFAKLREVVQQLEGQR